MVWLIVKWYAVLKGIHKGLTYRKPPMSMAILDQLIREEYLPAMREWMAQPLILQFDQLILDVNREGYVAQSPPLQFDQISKRYNRHTQQNED